MIELSIATNTGIDYFDSLPLDELLDTIKDVIKIGNKRKRIQAGNKNSRSY